METHITLEGFYQTEKMHGVRYTKFVWDGDSTVYSTLLIKVQVWCLMTLKSWNMQITFANVIEGDWFPNNLSKG